VTAITPRRDWDGHTRFSLPSSAELSWSLRTARNSTGARRRWVDLRRLRGIRCGLLTGHSRNNPSRLDIGSRIGSRQSSNGDQNNQVAVSLVTASWLPNAEY
jgi:hypothetical protein